MEEETKKAINEEILRKQLEEVNIKKQREFLEKFNKLSEEFKLTFGGQAFIDNEGKIRVNIIIIPTRN